MLKYLRAEIVLGALLATVFWAGVLGWQASFAPTEIQKQECYDAAKKSGHKQEECKTLWERTTTDPIALFNLILAFSTVGLWGATISLYRGGEKQFGAINRPEITIHAVEIAHTDGDETYEKVGASLLCFNKGRTAAVNVECRADILVTNKPIIDIQRVLIKTVGLLGSGQKLRVKVNSDRYLPDIRQHINLVGGPLLVNPFMYCVGTLSYVDQNGMRRETGFCYRLMQDVTGGLRWESAQSPEHEYAY